MSSVHIYTHKYLFCFAGDVKSLDVFSVDETTGVVTTKAAIDFEQDADYKVVLKALNPGTTQSASSTLNVQVTGVNEFTPEFTQNEYIFMVSESARPGSTLGSVSATDKDEGSDGVVYYYLVADSNLQGFSLDARTGALTMVNEIDREAVSEVELTVMAANDGPITSQNMAESKIRVMVRDANDPPMFTETQYQGYVQENMAPGATVIQVSSYIAFIFRMNRRNGS